MMVEVLVTGGAGFIGSNFVRYALEAEDGLKHTVRDPAFRAYYQTQYGSRP